MSSNRSWHTKLLIGLVVVLLGTNVYFMYKLISKDDTPTVNKVTQQYLTQISTDFTKIVDETIDKSVGISSINNNKVVSTGSGAVYKSEGGFAYIITNNHVIESGNEVEVLFANNESIKGEIIGADVISDLAIVKVPVTFQVEPFKIGDSSLTSVGEWVLAIGNPLGLEYYGSVTPGIISGKERVIPIDSDGDGSYDWDMVVLQTSAPINPGNSGGPLINLAGELIGINSMKIKDTSVEGMAFAIPINEAIEIIEQLITNGKVIRPIVGISGQSVVDIPLYLRNHYNIPLDVTEGVLVISVIDSGPAKKAGIQQNDIIVKFGGSAIKTFKNFRQELYSKKTGDSVEIEVVRNGENHTITVVLE